MKTTMVKCDRCFTTKNACLTPTNCQGEIECSEYGWKLIRFNNNEQDLCPACSDLYLNYFMRKKFIDASD